MSILVASIEFVEPQRTRRAENGISQETYSGSILIKGEFITASSSAVLVSCPFFKYLYSIKIHLKFNRNLFN